MTIDGLQTILMTQHDEIAVAARVPSYDTNLTAPCGADGIAHLNLDIRTFVHPAATPSERTRHVSRSRQDKTRHRDPDILFETVKHCTIRVHTLVRPDVTINTICRMVINEVGVQQELRRHFIDYIAILGTNNNPLRQQFQFASQDQSVVGEKPRQTLRQLGRTHV